MSVINTKVQPLYAPTAMRSTDRARSIFTRMMRIISGEESFWTESFP
jgi:hypothetical protein